MVNETQPDLFEFIVKLLNFEGIGAVNLIVEYI